MIGIYKITNLINGKVYIGQSVQIEKRWQNHKCAAKKEEGHLYKAMRKYGLENFKFEVIEECQKQELNDREVFWISYYNSIDPDKGYNLTKGGDSIAEKTKKIKDEDIPIIHDLLRQGINQHEIARMYGVDPSLINTINSGKYRRIEGVEYPIAPDLTHIKKKYYCIDCGKEIWKGSTRCRDCYCKSLIGKGQGKKPEREELKDLVRNNSFSSIAKMLGTGEYTIRRWCKSYDLPTNKKGINSYSDEEWKEL